jgi:hypothetical protein
MLGPFQKGLDMDLGLQLEAPDKPVRRVHHNDPVVEIDNFLLAEVVYAGSEPDQLPQSSAPPVAEWRLAGRTQRT